MEFNKDELNKLPPEERIKKLKLMEDEAKKQMEATKKLIDDSESLIKKSEEEITRAALKQGEDDFRRQGALKELSALVHHEEPGLEGIAGQAQRQRSKDEPVDISSVYQRVKDLHDQYAQGSMSYETVKELRETRERVDIALGYQQLSQETERTALASKRLVEDLLGSYMSNVKYTP